MGDLVLIGAVLAMCVFGAGCGVAAALCLGGAFSSLNPAPMRRRLMVMAIVGGGVWLASIAVVGRMIGAMHL